MVVTFNWALLIRNMTSEDFKKLYVSEKDGGISSPALPLLYVYDFRSNSWENGMGDLMKYERNGLKQEPDMPGWDSEDTLMYVNDTKIDGENGIYVMLESRVWSSKELKPVLEKELPNEIKHRYIELDNDRGYLDLQMENNIFIRCKTRNIPVDIENIRAFLSIATFDCMNFKTNLPFSFNGSVFDCASRVAWPSEVQGAGSFLWKPSDDCRPRMAAATA